MHLRLDPLIVLAMIFWGVLPSGADEYAGESMPFHPFANPFRHVKPVGKVQHYIDADVSGKCSAMQVSRDILYGGYVTRHSVLYDANNTVPLHAYVVHELEPAVLEVEHGHYLPALCWIDKFRASSPAAEPQAHYIRGLCLQALGRFSESVKEYVWVQCNGEDQFLHQKAALGAELAGLKNARLRPNQFDLPAGGMCPDIF